MSDKEGKFLSDVNTVSTGVKTVVVQLAKNKVDSTGQKLASDVVFKNTVGASVAGILSVIGILYTIYQVFDTISSISKSLGEAKGVRDLLKTSYHRQDDFLNSVDVNEYIRSTFVPELDNLADELALIKQSDFLYPPKRAFVGAKFNSLLAFDGIMGYLNNQIAMYNFLTDNPDYKEIIAIVPLRGYCTDGKLPDKDYVRLASSSLGSGLSIIDYIYQITQNLADIDALYQDSYYNTARADLDFLKTTYNGYLDYLSADFESQITELANRIQIKDYSTVFKSMITSIPFYSIRSQVTSFKSIPETWLLNNVADITNHISADNIIIMIYNLSYIDRYIEIIDGLLASVTDTSENVSNFKSEYTAFKSKVQGFEKNIEPYVLSIYQRKFLSDYNYLFSSISEKSLQDKNSWENNRAGIISEMNSYASYLTQQSPYNKINLSLLTLDKRFYDTTTLFSNIFSGMDFKEIQPYQNDRNLSFSKEEYMKRVPNIDPNVWASWQNMSFNEFKTLSDENKNTTFLKKYIYKWFPEYFYPVDPFESIKANILKLPFYRAFTPKNLSDIPDYINFVNSELNREVTLINDKISNFESGFNDINYTFSKQFSILSDIFLDNEDPLIVSLLKYSLSLINNVGNLFRSTFGLLRNSQLLYIKEIYPINLVLSGFEGFKYAGRFNVFYQLLQPAFDNLLKIADRSFTDSLVVSQVIYNMELQYKEVTYPVPTLVTVPTDEEIRDRIKLTIPAYAHVSAPTAPLKITDAQLDVQMIDTTIKQQEAQAVAQNQPLPGAISIPEPKIPEPLIITQLTSVPDIIVSPPYKSPDTISNTSVDELTANAKVNIVPANVTDNPAVKKSSIVPTIIIIGSILLL
jgi:hypothetical protein